MNTTRNLLIAGAALLALAACSSDTTASTTTAAVASPTTTAAASPTTTAATAASEAAATGAVTVSIGDFKFEPATMNVKVGGTITWTNNHTQPHTATSSGNFDTGSLAPGASKTITVAKAGTFSYICSFHPFMTGTVTVA